MSLARPLTRTRPEDRLAVNGGTPVIPAGYTLMSRWPRIGAEDVDRMVAQLRSGLLTEMSCRAQLHEFESELAIFTHTRYAVAFNSGTAALHCALAGVGVEAGDDVVLPALTYIACAAAVIHQNAIPVLADIDPATYNVTAETIERAMTAKTRAIIVVHLHGLPADMADIMALAERHGVPVIEDFSQAVGASYRDRPAGGLGTVGVASLMAGKNLASAGEAGILVTNDLAVRNRASQVKCFGELLDPQGGYTLQHGTLGYNYRINLLSAALVSQQLFRLDEFTEARRAGAAQLDARLARLPGFHPPLAPADSSSCYHMYRFSFDPEEAGLRISLDQMREGLKKAFWEEGLPLVEFQNQPLAGHDLLQRRLGYGRGCPWTCHGRSEMRYDIAEYPGALTAIRRSLIVGYPSQGALANPEAVDAYDRVFAKMEADRRGFERFAAGLVAAPPWAEPARLF
ncbi:DegT/DnrJ/EryC1/StrS family aminotransferase [Sphingomonas sp. UV9]|uniref:DegT/DnrJ/EryC1/StrS family aminotransferase n=1 Tax=Sphingomonas sp. UV9 TaxID=1851410 RepID=UPI000FFBEC26|nr:DegT/DnrJ/EryC1/StrS family aminotransferase [Sphingomonas sp. UV9]RXD05728.1 DegT/DnrJ/EryC1/StrS family aminotransferase [Sphingomonas sp. UV9]